MAFTDRQIRDFVQHIPGNALQHLPQEALEDDRFLNQISHAQFMSLARASWGVLPSTTSLKIQAALKRRAENEPNIRMLVEGWHRFEEPLKSFFCV